jgi:hypothetical protein
MNQGITLTDVQSMNSALTTNVLTAEESPFSQESILRRRGGDAPLGIPSFVWGLCLGVPGIAIVYFVSDDKDETMKALWGCVASGVVEIIVYIIYVVAVVNAATEATTI